MRKYFLTVFDSKGKNLLNEVIEAGDDSEAKDIGINRLTEDNYLEHTSRLVRSSGGLVHFHQ